MTIVKLIFRGIEIKALDILKTIYLDIGIEKGEIKWSTVTSPAIVFSKFWQVRCHAITFLQYKK